MIPYYFIILSSAILSIWRTTNKQTRIIKNLLTIILVSLPLLVVCAIRDYSVGSDTRMYAINWALPEISGSSLQEILVEGRWEIGFALLCKLCLLTGNPSRCLLVISSIIIFSLLTISIFKLMNNPPLGFLLFILAGEFYGSMNTMRQVIAISIVSIALIFFKNKNLLPYLLTIILAATFHRSALVLLLLPFTKYILSRKSHQISTIFITSLCFILLLLPPNVMEYLLGAAGYENYVGTNYGSSGHIAPVLFFLCFVSWGISWIIEKQETTDYCCSAILLLGLIVSIGGIKSAIIFRVVDYFFVAVILFSSYFKASVISKKSNIIANVLFYAPFIGLFILLTYVVPEWTCTIPYTVGTDL